MQRELAGIAIASLIVQPHYKCEFHFILVTNEDDGYIFNTKSDTNTHKLPVQPIISHQNDLTNRRALATDRHCL